MADFDSLFPAKDDGKSFDALFPAGPERERQAGIRHGPFEDLIFGDTSVNPVARVLDQFGEGFSQAWGADKIGLSDEHKATLESAGIKAKDYLDQQGAIAKAANQVLFRPAARYLYDWLKFEAAHSDVFMRTWGGAFRGSQAAVAQIGAEFGQPKLGRELAAMAEAFPTGIHGTIGAGPGILESAQALRVIGRGEASWKGTAPVEQVPKAAAAPTPAGLPVSTGAEVRPLVITIPNVHAAARQAEPALFGQYDALVEQRDNLRSWIAEQRAEGIEAPAATTRLAEVDATIGQIAPDVQRAYRTAAEAAGTPTVAPRQFPSMAAMLAAQGENAQARFIAAGEAPPPAGEGAQAAGTPIEDQRAFIAGDVARQLVAAGRPEAEAQAAGALVAARYETRAARFSGALGTAEDLYRREGAEIRGAKPPTEPTPTAAAPEQPLAPAPAEAEPSLLQFLAANGGLRSDDPLIADLRQSIGAQNKFIPGFGQLIRAPKEISTAAQRSGRKAPMSLDAAREAAANAGYIVEEGSNIDTLLQASDRELRGERVYRAGYLPPNRPHEPGELEHARQSFLTDLDATAKEIGMTLTERERLRALEIWQKEGINDEGVILERLALETREEPIEAGATDGLEPALPGWDDVHGGAAPGAGAIPAEVPAPAGAAGGGAPRGGSEADREAAAEAEYFQRRPRPRNLVAEREAEGQLGLLGTERITPAEQAQRAAEAPLKPTVAQEPMDVGLFSDEAAQKELFQAPIYYSMVARTVENAKQAKASGEQWLSFLKNQPGVKSEEMEWLGLDEWLKEQKGQVSKEQIADYIRANAIEVREVQLGATPSLNAAFDLNSRLIEKYGSLEEAFRRWTPEEQAQFDRVHAMASGDRAEERSTKYRQYTLPGGENYRELLLTLPDRGGSRLADLEVKINAGSATLSERQEYHALVERGQRYFRGSHWDEPNVLAHIRFDDRITDGKKTLHVAEIQSDWHQAGRKRGYAGAPEIATKRALTAEEARRVGLKEGDEQYVVERNGQIIGSGETPEEAQQYANLLEPGAGVPDAPFKTTWPELSLKRMIRYAAENGYERLSWDTGETNAERYDLSKQVESIQVSRRTDARTGEKDHAVLISLPNGHAFSLGVNKEGIVDNVGASNPEMKGKRLDEVIGKEMADKILATEGSAKFSGEGLKVGGEGMRGFYDKILPAAANKLVKKFGGKVGESRVPTEEAEQIPQAAPSRIVRLPGGHFSIETEDGARFGMFNTKQAQAAYLRLRADQLALTATAPVHTLDLTPELKQAAVEQGVPLFQTQQGKITIRPERRPIITLAKSADASTFIHETGHQWLEELMRDAEHEAAPQLIRDDAQAVRDWLGVDSADAIKTRHHEKFARGFEQYLREGIAPSPGLAHVFAQFRDWLLQIYQSLRGLGAEITPEIRGVFDRLLAEEPQRTVIAPDLAKRPTLQDIHAADVRLTAPPEAERAADRVIAEDARARAEESEAIADEHRRGAEQANLRPAESRLLGEAGAAQQPVTPGATVGGEPRAEPQGGGGPLPEGAGLRAAKGAPGSAGSIEPLPIGPHVPLDSLPKAGMDKVGNIRLENLDTPADVNDAIRNLYRENQAKLDAATRGVVSDQSIMDLADAMGTDPRVVANNMERLRQMTVQDGVPLAARIWLLRDVFTKLASEVSRTMQGEDELAYAQARQRFLMAHETLSGVTAEMGRGLRAFRTMKAETTDANLLAIMLKENTGKTLFQLQQEMKLGRAAETPAQVARMVSQAAMSPWERVRAGIISYVINNLISGPLTHAGYSVGNQVLTLYKTLLETPVAAGIGAIEEQFGLTTPAERVHFGETGARLYGIVYGAVDGIVPSYNALKTGVSMMKGDPSGIDLFSGETSYRPQAIPGRAGYVLETPSRAVAAIHTMHYGMNYEAEISAMAYRDAMGKGLRPGTDAFNTSVADFRQNPSAAAMQTAHDSALGAVLMKRPAFGTAQYHFQQWVNKNLLVKLVMPFVQIGTNILREGFVERTPLAPLMSKAARDDLMGRNGAAARQTRVAQMAVGSGLAAGVLGLASQELITGGGPSDPKQREVLEMTGWKPYSIKLGGEYIPYRKYLSALGPLVAGTADIYEVYKTGQEQGLGKAAAAALFGFAEVVADETWMRGATAFIDAARHWDRNGEKYLRNLSMEFLPFSVGLRQIAAMTDPSWREVQSTLDALKNHIPGLSQTLFPVRDLWGEPMRGGTMMSPSPAVNDPATNALQKAEYYPARIERKIRGVQLDEQQYDDLTRIAGRHTKMLINGLVANPGFDLLPKEFRQQELRKLFEAGRETGRQAVMMQNPQIIQQAMAAKNKMLQSLQH